MLQQVGKIYRFAVRQDQLDFLFWHAQRLDVVVHRRTRLELAQDGSQAQLGRQMVVELRVETETGDGHVYSCPLLILNCGR